MVMLPAAAECSVRRPVASDVEGGGIIHRDSHEWRLSAEGEGVAAYCIHCLEMVQGVNEIRARHGSIRS